MTDEEAIKQWENHSPWERASAELIRHIQRLNKPTPPNTDELEKEVGEALL